MSALELQLDVERIARAAAEIDPAVRDSPLLPAPTLCPRPGVELLLKLEVLNPMRSFKGRGSDLLMRGADPSTTVVCASAGNLGQGLAWAGGRHGVPVRIHSSRTVPSAKLERMRALGAELILVDGDFDEAKASAAADAAAAGRLVVDGVDVELAEGAGTIAVELTALDAPPDIVVVGVGNGSMAAGIGAWLRAVAPETRLVAVGATGAPAMRDAWRTGALTLGPPISTCAEGLAAREPVGPVTATLRRTVDDYVLVEDAELIEAMGALHRETGLVIEASGAAPLAAVRRLAADELAGARVALVLGGGNASPKTLAAALDS